MLQHTTYDLQLALVDSFPVPVFHFARAYRCRKLSELADFGYAELAKQPYYRLHTLVRVCYPGVIVAPELTPANIADTAVVEDLTELFTGTLLGDQSLRSPKLTRRLQPQGVILLAPYKSARRQAPSYLYGLTNLRRRIEAVFGHLVERFDANQASLGAMSGI